ncbi:MAG: MFS transporter [Pseudomonadota bacterium]
MTATDQGDGASTDVAQPRNALATACTAHITQDGVSATVYVVLPVIAQAFGLSYAQVGLFKGLKSVAQGIFEILSGFISDRFGESRVLATGLLVSGSGFLTLAFAPGAIAVGIALCLVGVGTALHHAPSSSLIVSAYGDSGRRSALGYYNASGDVGKLAFSGLFSATIALGVYWQSITLVFAMAAIAAATFIEFRAPATKVKTAEQREEKSQDAPSRWGVLHVAPFTALLVVVFIQTLVQAGALVFVAFLMLEKGLPLAIATAATVVLLLGGVFGKAFCGKLLERFGVKIAFAIVQTLTALGLATIVFAPAWLAFAALLPLGAVVQGSTSVTYGFTADLIHPQRMARGYALLYGSSALSSAAGPLMFGLLADGPGLNVAMLAMACVALLATMPLGYLARFESDQLRMA